MFDSGSEVDLEQFDYLLSSARSVRRKLDFDRPVDIADIYASIDVAVQAPTGIAGENWRFLVVVDPVPKAQIAALYTEVLVEIMRARDMEMKPTHKALTDRLHEMPAHQNKQIRANANLVEVVELHGCDRTSDARGDRLARVAHEVGHAEDLARVLRLVLEVPASQRVGQKTTTNLESVEDEC